MYQKMIEEEDTIYELDEECVNKKQEERENGRTAITEKTETDKKLKKFF